MRGESLPRDARSWLCGLMASLCMLVFCVLLGASLVCDSTDEQTVALVIIGTPKINSDLKEEFEIESEPGIQLSYRLESEGVSLNSAGRAVINRTCFISAGIDRGGSGFMFTHDLMVTAYHVIEDVAEDAVEVFCARPGEGATQARAGIILARDAYSDVAFIRVAGFLPADTPTMTLSTEAPEMLEPLHMFGFERTDDRCSRSFIGVHRPTSHIAQTNLYEAGLDCPAQQIELLAGLAQQGNSGGPVFREDGSIVGMIIIILPARNVTLMVPAFTIESLMLFNGLMPEPPDE